MPNSLTTSEPNVLHPEDFDPPLKRKEPIVPYYWTLDEIATELGVTSRRVGYDITGYPPRKIQPSLKAYKAGSLFLVPDADALAYIQRFRERKKS
ncbi:hypothetical protein PCC7424_5618 (plasmid) [Gloeothece citriformis PCC 7424]|uniref:Uncharacterized protein n=1 Tax=Gloeothece citriformis (strain PCC 7424) TaxID=65393 RepID=B7KN05_GLOC7|nr:hypothetical protein [Gloeothece citriformis]ACK74177.1 hypothetical protein PCC7424_5618 [Gloeothece citriformis PCC 7424]